jgi:branched-chain amino acid transport system substrate-binding protein
MSNKKIVWVAVVVVLVAIVSGIYFSSTNTSKDSVNVGVILPLTGGLAKVGSDAKVGLELAQEDFKSSGVSLVFEDDGFVPKDSVSAFNKIKDLSDVVAIIGPLNGSSIESVRSLAVNNKLPVFTPWGAGNDIGDYVYKNSVEATDEAKAIADKANSLGYKKLAIIYLNNDFGLKHFNSFKASVENNSGVLVAQESFIFGTKDFRTSLAKIKAAKPDALYVVNSGGAGVGEITKEAWELGLKVPFFGQYATEASDLIPAGGDSLEGMIYSFPINAKALTDKQKEFISRFEKKVGGAPQIVAYNAYDIYSVLVKAVDLCKKDTVCINGYIANHKDFDGVGGKFSIINGKLVREFYFKTIHNGEFVPVN